LCCLSQPPDAAQHGKRLSEGFSVHRIARGQPGRLVSRPGFRPAAHPTPNYMAMLPKSRPSLHHFVYIMLILYSSPLCR
jgi:hypothetical protein